MLPFADQVAIVTGTSRGIGRFLAGYLAERGATVVGFSRTAPNSPPEGFRHETVDVTDERAVTAAVARVHRQEGRIDILVNNAGVASMNHSLLIPGSTVERLMQTNFTGAFFACREVARVMQRRHYGRVVNVGTVAVALQLEGESVYAASKSAVITFSKIFAREVGPYGITCNVVCPSPIETDLIRNVPKDKVDKIVQSLAIKRLGRFEDVANVVEFYCRRESEYVTGQVVYLGGVS